MTYFPRKHQSFRGGFTLYEILIALVIAALAFNVGARLISLTVRSYGESAIASKQLKTNRQWLEQMRRDVWSAHTFDVVDHTTLKLDRGVAWRSHDTELIRESTDEPARRWSIEGRQLHWFVDNDVLLLGDETSTIPLASPASAKAGG